MVAQRRSLISGAEKPAALQDRNHLIDEEVQLAGEGGGYDVEPARRPRLEPGHDMVHDLLRCPDDGAVRSRRCDKPATLADRKVLGIGFVEQTFDPRREVDVCRTDVRDGKSGVSGQIVKAKLELLAQHPDSDGRMKKLVEFFLFAQ